MESLQREGAVTGLCMPELLCDGDEVVVLAPQVVRHVCVDVLDEGLERHRRSRFLFMDDVVDLGGELTTEEVGGWIAERVAGSAAQVTR